MNSQLDTPTTTVVIVPAARPLVAPSSRYVATPWFAAASAVPGLSSGAAFGSGPVVVRRAPTNDARARMTRVFRTRGRGLVTEYPRG